MPYPKIPDEISRDVDLRRLSAAEAFQRSMWEPAAEGMNEIYEYLLSQQDVYHQRFHKGWELHNGGVALLQLGRLEEGVDRILLAYVEDALSADPGEEDGIDDGLAGNFLRSAGPSEGILELLTVIKQSAKQRKPDNIPRDPRRLLDEATADLARDRAYDLFRDKPVYFEPERLKPPPEERTVEALTSTYERRCFVGGNYHAGGPNLEEIIQIVRDEEFDPIVANQFELRESDVHHRSLLLLHLCHKAVFEVTSAAGQLMELERCRDYDIRPLLVRNTLAGQDPHVSKMIESMAGVKVYPYSKIEEHLRPTIQDYVHNRGDWAPKP